ncbi:MAG: sterol desaturase family protein [Pseudomonadota bacterium]
MRALVAAIAWPYLLLSSCAILAFGFARGEPTLFFNISYVWIIVWLLLLERLMPYRPLWRQGDGQLGADVGHTVLNKGLVQILLIQFMTLGLIPEDLAGPLAELPLWGQVGIGLIISEFGLYWAHRIAHQWPLLWRFHAVHHSVKKLWLVNTGRFHFVDSLASVSAGAVIMLLCGLSIDAIVWISAITAYIGVLTHCNVDMNCNVMNWVFNTPNLHRWHHSSIVGESNTNYGENLMLWDQLFGTYLYKPSENVGNLGISDAIPNKLWGQLMAPFMWRRYQAQPSLLGKEIEDLAAP